MTSKEKRRGVVRELNNETVRLITYAIAEAIKRGDSRIILDIIEEHNRQIAEIIAGEDGEAR